MTVKPWDCSICDGVEPTLRAWLKPSTMLIHCAVCLENWLAWTWRVFTSWSSLRWFTYAWATLRRHGKQQKHVEYEETRHKNESAVTGKWEFAFNCLKSKSFVSQLIKKFLFTLESISPSHTWITAIIFAIKSNRTTVGNPFKPIVFVSKQRSQCQHSYCINCGCITFDQFCWVTNRMIF